MAHVAKIAVLGGGSFGTTLAHLLTQNHHRVTLWSRDPMVTYEINSVHENSKYLPGISLQQFEATNDLESAIRGADSLFFAVPCQQIRSLLELCHSFISSDQLVVNLAKGIELESLKTPSQIFSEILGLGVLERYVMLSGPTFARELCLSLPTGAVAASHNILVANWVQRMTCLPFFRIYTTSDVMGVELGGAMKNVLAIGVGIADGLGYGLNTRAGLITRCLHEMMVLGHKMGANEKTFSGLSGIGDLILTCTGELSRNRKLGFHLGRGLGLESLLKDSLHVVEGVPTAQAIYLLASRLNIELPNVTQVYKILYEDLPPKEAVTQLLARELKMEFPEDAEFPIKKNPHH